MSVSAWITFSKCRLRVSGAGVFICRREHSSFDVQWAVSPARVSSAKDQCVPLAAEIDPLCLWTKSHGVVVYRRE